MIKKIRVRLSRISLIKLAFSALSGLLLGLAFPYFNWWFIGWFGLTPLLVILFSSDIFDATLYGFAAGIAFFAITAYWMFIFGPLAGFAFVIFQSVFLAAFGAAAVIIHRVYERGLRPIQIAALWTGIELIRSLGPLGLSFGALGYSQHKMDAALAASSFIGVSGISFLMALSNQAIAEMVIAARQKRISWPAPIRTALFLLIPLIILAASQYGRSKQTAENEEGAWVAILQPNIAQEVKWQPLKKESILKTHLKLAQQAASKKPDLIIWPETAIPSYLLDEEEYVAKIIDLAKDSGAYMLVGGLYERADLEGGGKAVLNSAFLFAPNGKIVGRYDKLRIIPFGEYIPLRPIFSKLKALEAIAYDTYPGSEMTVFNTELGRFSAVICFESTDAFLVGGFARRGAEALMVMTNDGWFKETAAAEHHLVMAKFRAAENGFYLVQAANTGISAIIDDRGGVVSKTSLGQERVLFGRVVLCQSKTFYSRFGYLLPWALLAASVITIILAFKRKPL